MTLPERFDQYDFRGINIKRDEIRRALAIAQAVEQMASEESFWTVRQAICRANELLAAKEQEP